MNLSTSNQSLRSVFWAKQNRYVREAALIALGVALLALASQLVVPLKPVPLTFQSAVVVLIGMTYGARLGGITLISYLIAGSIGLPVFSGMASGLEVFLGPTAGYLAGFLPAALLAGFLAQRGFAQTISSAFITALLSVSIIFVFGLAGLSYFIGWKQAVAVGLMPFILTEPLKLMAISLIAPFCWKK